MPRRQRRHIVCLVWDWDCGGLSDWECGNKFAGRIFIGFDLQSVLSFGLYWFETFFSFIVLAASLPIYPWMSFDKDCLNKNGAAGGFSVEVLRELADLVGNEKSGGVPKEFFILLPIHLKIKRYFIKPCIFALEKHIDRSVIAFLAKCFLLPLDWIQLHWQSPVFNAIHLTEHFKETNDGSLFGISSASRCTTTKISRPIGLGMFSGVQTLLGWERHFRGLKFSLLLRGVVGTQISVGTALTINPIAWSSTTTWLRMVELEREGSSCESVQVPPRSL